LHEKSEVNCFHSLPLGTQQTTPAALALVSALAPAPAPPAPAPATKVSRIDFTLNWRNFIPNSLWLPPKKMAMKVLEFKTCNADSLPKPTTPSEAQQRTKCVQNALEQTPVGEMT